MTTSGYSSWMRIGKHDGSSLTITVNDITPERRLLPHISSYSHPYLATLSPEEEIWFQISTDGIPMRYLYFLILIVLWQLIQMLVCS